LIDFVTTVVLGTLLAYIRRSLINYVNINNIETNVSTAFCPLS
jgi:hypothetical protein